MGQESYVSMQTKEEEFLLASYCIGQEGGRRWWVGQKKKGLEVTKHSRQSRRKMHDETYADKVVVGDGAKAP